MSISALYQKDKVNASDFPGRFTFLDIYPLDKISDHQRMDVIEIRRENARRLAEVAGGNTAFAEKVGISDSRSTQLIGPNPSKNIGHGTAKRIEKAFGTGKGWLDIYHPKGENSLIEVTPDELALVQTYRSSETAKYLLDSTLATLRDLPRAN